VPVIGERGEKERGGKKKKSFQQLKGKKKILHRSKAAKEIFVWRSRGEKKGGKREKKREGKKRGR